ncbi:MULTISPECIES: ABC transporter ATP-binding protein [Oceanobacillus]|uniref:Oligopeptide transport ATP-binding protein OppD n=2 Tax=Oceanobacillus TaxID=182709 RepID=A0A0A1MVD2_9BACI|nr:ABC transporter ATP-binding protein [Oceanobacillus oncorhynchi]MDM8099649.1 ABC transporter ATP-binding protein [Oceanobacillus oncorhynchi]CEI83402.1 Oligopeptide transport ATP-binding protein OppD [Oceanobacillus oncorhynchi]
MAQQEPLLSVHQLKAHFQSEDGLVKAVDGINFDVYQGETVCIVGESGCGKSVTAMSIMGLLPDTSKVEGEINLAGKDLTKLSKGNMRRIRGNELSMIFQEPMTSLNPVMTIGEQMTEVLLEHQAISKKQATKKSLELIKMVGIGRGEQIIKSYPHQLSGGMLQRVMIAIALACDPKMLIADEPTTALDVTIQAQVLNLLQDLKEETNMSMLLITHDLGVVAEVADRVVVMYAGKVVEQGTVEEIFANPKHPYTKGLLQAKPVLGSRKKKLYTIPGQVPKLVDLKPSCYFADRCEHCMKICTQQTPELKSDDSSEHKVACWLYENEVVHK